MIPLLWAGFLAVQIAPLGPDLPLREPQMASNGSTVALTFGAGNAIYFAKSSDAGKTFSKPVKVAEAEILPLNRHRGPRIAMTSGAIVISAVSGKKAADGPHAHGLPSDGDLWVWRSVDNGGTWSSGVRINDIPGAPTEGLHTLAADGNGNLFAAWLDKRGSHGTSLYGARSNDGGVTWSRNFQIYESPEGSICECCHPSAVFAPDGQAVVMWRNWLEGSRDMYLSRSVGASGFHKPEKLGLGSWKLNACPMDGGGIAFVAGRVVTAWRRDGDIFLASPGQREVSLGKGVDVAVAAGDQGGVYVVWSSPNGIVAAVPGRAAPITLAPKGSFPTVVRISDGRALAAWEAANGISVQEIPGLIPTR